MNENFTYECTVVLGFLPNEFIISAVLPAVNDIKFKSKIFPEVESCLISCNALVSDLLGAIIEESAPENTFEKRFFPKDNGNIPDWLSDEMCRIVIIKTEQNTEDVIVAQASILKSIITPKFMH